jgi:cytochrome c oxidase assembly protein subunit 11
MSPKTPPPYPRLTLWLVFGALGMFGFGFALVPLYNVLCKATGINGKVDISGPQSGIISAPVDLNRTITLEFTTTLNENLPWEFRPMQTKVALHPGERFQTAYFAKNLSPNTMTVQAIPSITPGKAAAHIKKMACFCFEKQVLKAGESAEMGLTFVVDPALPPEVHTISLSYTLFDLTKLHPEEKAHVHPP